VGKGKAALPGCYNACMGLYREFHTKAVGVPPYLEGPHAAKARDAMCRMIEYLLKLPSCGTEDKVVQAFEVLFANWHLVSDWKRKQTALPEIERNLIEILNELRTAKDDPNFKRRAAAAGKEQLLRSLTRSAKRDGGAAGGEAGGAGD
jgi:hypothetical protein